MQYYNEQLRNRLTTADIKVKFISESGETNWLNINNESMQAITQYFEYLKTINYK